MIIDYAGTISEVYETNNVRYYTFGIQVSGSPDLGMKSFVYHAPSSATPVGNKTKLTFSYNVENKGKNNAGVNYLYVYYGSATSTRSLTKLWSTAIPALKPGEATGTKTYSLLATLAFDME